MNYAIYLGIDYSGAATPETRLAGLQVYAARATTSPRRVPPPGASRTGRHWSRRKLAEWLGELAAGDQPWIAGIDHGFSVPDAYFRRYRLSTWDRFLEDFARHWPTDRPGASVEEIRGHRPPRRGSNREMRLTETWTSSAKSVFQFDVQGQVAKSTHAGIPWLYWLRRQAAERIHFWPFDGWRIEPGRSAVVEVFPSMLRRRYPRQQRTVDEHDAYCVARWLQQIDRLGHLPRYLDPPISEDQRGVATREGWILGVT